MRERAWLVKWHIVFTKQAQQDAKKNTAAGLFLNHLAKGSYNVRQSFPCTPFTGLQKFE